MKSFSLKSKNGTTVLINIHDAVYLSDSDFLHPDRSCVRIEFKSEGFSIYMAGKKFKKDKNLDWFYQFHHISEIFNLLDLPHGTDEDDYDHSIQNFFSSANNIHSSLSKDNNVLVHCNNGRSRTGAVIAAYLMKYHGLSADDAISIIVKAALETRGYDSKDANIDIKITAHKGTYGQRLRFFEKKDKENLPPNVLFATYCLEGSRKRRATEQSSNSLSRT